MEPAITTALMSYGPAGVAIVILLGFIRVLLKKIDAIQEQRIKDGMEMARVATTAAAACEVSNRNATLILNELQLRGRLEPPIGVLHARPST